MKYMNLYTNCSDKQAYVSYAVLCFCEYCENVLNDWFLFFSYFCKKVAHTRLPSVRFRSLSRFLAVSLQVMWVLNPAVGCHYFPPGLQLPLQPLRGLLPILLLGEQSVNSLPQTVTRQRRDCDLNPGPSAPTEPPCIIVKCFVAAWMANKVVCVNRLDPGEQ